jgi:Ni,Fe-hydrogenase I cytochrome b subunit
VQEEEMNRDARLMSGILLIAVPTIQYGGYFLLRLFSGQMPGMKPSPLQTSFFRAGHAHAGVLVILSLICQILVEHAALGPFAWLVRIAGVLSFGGVHAGSPK